MTKVIAVTNQKGGVGKTTTATALATGLKREGYNTLLMDLDPQCNSTDTFRAIVYNVATMYDVLVAGDPIEEAVQHTDIGDIVAGDPLLADQKDDTDTEFALRLAISMGAECITVLGGTGSRLDHVLGNIELLGIGLELGVEIELLDANNRIRMTDHGMVLKKEEQFGKYVSLIPYTAQVEHLYLAGFKYPLADYCLKGFCSIGVSNEITEEQAEITFENGILIVIESRDDAAMADES